MIKFSNGCHVGTVAYQVVQNLVSDDLYHIEGGSRIDRVNDHVAMNANEMFGIEYAVFILFRNNKNPRVSAS